LPGASPPASKLCILTKNLTAHLTHNGRAVLPKKTHANRHISAQLVQNEHNGVRAILKFVKKMSPHPLTKSQKRFKLYLALKEQEC
jgi:hypothetical protein